MGRLPSHIKDEPHIRVSATTFDDAEEEGVSPVAAGMLVAMGCRIRQLRSDGWIGEAHVAKLGFPAWRKHIAALEAAQWIEPTRDERTGRTRWFVPGYPKWNPIEEDYTRVRHNGRVGGCQSKHEQPCQRPDCEESRAWLAAHPQPHP